ncbi:hypothetical protein [Cloacibacillus porcorum]|uniref:hypothetical protein n=1 Tax=Cloacibacillus porcorum TaxID=1197717 RepID=UPI002357AFCE|nr:hypothetical protein [Cloacibacillus porcorum]
MLATSPSAVKKGLFAPVTAWPFARRQSESGRKNFRPLPVYVKEEVPPLKS